MRFYWMKITLGALAIFGVGMLIVAAYHSVRHKVQVVKDTASPITFPLPFGIVPFRLDGERLGTLERVRLERESPKVISGVTIWAKLDDSVSATQLQGCRFAINDVEHFDQHSTFDCVKTDTTGLAPYGQLEMNGQSFPLLVPERVIADMHRSHSRNARVWVNDSVVVDTVSLHLLADSMAEMGRRMQEAGQRMSDSIRRAVQRQVDSIQRANGVPQVPQVPAVPTKP